VVAAAEAVYQVAVDGTFAPPLCLASIRMNRSKRHLLPHLPMDLPAGGPPHQSKDQSKPLLLQPLEEEERAEAAAAVESAAKEVMLDMSSADSCQQSAKLVLLPARMMKWLEVAATSSLPVPTPALLCWDLWLPLPGRSHSPSTSGPTLPTLKDLLVSGFRHGQER